LGSGMVSLLRRQGATVIVADICILEEKGDEIRLDITHEESVRKGVDHILATHGRIDGWVNNAYPRTADWGKKLEEVSFNSWKTNVDMHLNGYFICCQYVLKQMKAQRCGSLVNMSSIYGVVAPDFKIYDDTDMTTPAAYSAIKGGILSLTRYLASYYGPFGIRVNSISPGGIYDGQTDSFVKKYEEKTPLGRMGRIDDIAPAVVYLLSDESAYVTGHNLVIDGGWSTV